MEYGSRSGLLLVIPLIFGPGSVSNGMLPYARLDICFVVICDYIVCSHKRNIDTVVVLHTQPGSLVIAASQSAVLRRLLMSTILREGETLVSSHFLRLSRSQKPR